MERLKFTLNDDLHEWLERLAKRPGSSKSKIVCDALRTYMARAARIETDAILKARLDKISNQLSRIERDQQIILESLALFIRHQFSITPPLPAQEFAAARALSGQRFAAFVAEVGRRLAQGKTMINEVEDAMAQSATKAATATGVAGDPSAAGEQSRKVH